MIIPKIKVRTSKIHGHGVYAAEDISKNKHIIEYTGERISQEEADKRYRSQKDIVLLFELDKNTVVDGSVGGSDAVYINHSCNPNCRVEIKKKKIWITANRKIKKGEELTYDYAFDADSDTHYCNCGAGNCRGTINEKD